MGADRESGAPLRVGDRVATLVGALVVAGVVVSALSVTSRPGVYDGELMRAFGYPLVWRYEWIPLPVEVTSRWSAMVPRNEEPVLLPGRLLVNIALVGAVLLWPVTRIYQVLRDELVPALRRRPSFEKTLLDRIDEIRGRAER